MKQPELKVKKREKITPIDNRKVILRPSSGYTVLEKE